MVARDDVCAVGSGGAVVQRVVRWTHDHHRQGFDGEDAWVATGDRVTRLTTGTDCARIRAIAMRYLPLKNRPADLQIVGIERVSGHDAYVARTRVDAATVRTRTSTSTPACFAGK
jgi:hypothetical protein